MSLLTKVASILTSIVLIGKRVIYWENKIIDKYKRWRKRAKEAQVDKSMSSDKHLYGVVFKIKAKRKKRRDES